MSTHNRTQTQARNALKDTGPSSRETTDTSLEPHEIHDILSSKRRYQTIKQLLENPGTKWQALVEKIAAIEENTTTDDVSPAARNRVRASLSQTHLPTLEDANVITRDGDTIQLGPAADVVTAHMPEVESEQSLLGRVSDHATSLFQ